MRNSIRRASGGCALALCALVSLPGCSNSSPAYPDEAAANQYLTMLTSLVESGNADNICSTSSISRSACLNALEVSGGEAPADPPRVVCTWVFDDTYRVLVVEGKTASGLPYVNHLALTTKGEGEGSVQATQPIYWVNAAPPSSEAIPGGQTPEWAPKAECR